MNYLAHLYLSGNDKNILVGNFIADDVKGKKYTAYPQGIQQGIFLHRKIDQFSDTHPLFNQSKKRLYPVYHHYARVVNDIFYDHFLAKDWEQFSDMPLQSFSSYCYKTLLSYWFHLPGSVKQYLPFIIMHKRLTAYAEIDGLKDSLQVMSRHSSLPDHSNEAIDILCRDYDAYRAEFHEFFPEIIRFCNEQNK
jgi:acyl carrier protein phosphodiesterase